MYSIIISQTFCRCYLKLLIIFVSLVLYSSRSVAEERHGKPHRSPSPRKDEKYRRQRVSGYTKSQTPAFSRERIHRLKRKLSAEELERRRLEMMEDAKQRERDRESNVHRYKQEEDKEREKDQQKKESKFLHNMKLESAATSSLEDRVKRNIHGIQRTSAALEKNFMKR
uniref:CWC25 spliceosome associated protein homolog n=1 Tax=Leptobrachium leishanense TaxID=445787 RepID=A0A8C5QCP5_9ANUR